MKKASYLIMLVFAGATFQQCANQEAEDAGTVSKVTFESTLQSSALVTRPGVELTTISISLVNPNGKLVVQKELKVFQQGNVLQSEAIELAQGEYRIKQFTINDSKQAVQFFLPINRPTSCEPDKNLLKTFYAGGDQTKRIVLELKPVFSSEQPGS